jgi:hypothetical protein
MNKKTLLIAAIAFTALVVGLLAYFIPRHTEAGLLTMAQAGGPGDSPVTWEPDQVPLRVSIDDHSMGRDVDAAQQRDLASVVGDINTRLGFQLFKVVDHAPSVFVMSGAPTSDKHKAGGVATFTFKGGHALHVNIKLRNVVTSAEFGCALRHELMHAAGLAHDDFRSSVMYWRIDSDNCGFTSRITDADRDLLRSLYSK